jgi:hypothetical protein
MEKIVFSDTLTVWKTSFDLSNKKTILDESFKFIEDNPNVNPTKDLYTYFIDPKWKVEEYLNFEPSNGIEAVMLAGIKSTLCLVDKAYDIIQTNIWINRVKKTNPIQPSYINKFIYHNHVDTNAGDGLPAPLYTFVSYIQMPDVVKEQEGKLLFKDIDDKVYSLLPAEGDTIIFNGFVPHAVNLAKDSNVDRIVIAGSIGIEKTKLI